MLKNKVMFIGIGQCGGNIALEFYEKGYTTLFVQLIDVIDGNGTESKLLAKSPIGSTYHAYVLNKDSDFTQEQTEARFGRPLDYFKGYTDGPTYVMVFGLGVPRDSMEHLIRQYEDSISGISDEKNSSFMPHLSHVELPKQINNSGRLTTEVQVQERQGIDSLFSELD